LPDEPQGEALAFAADGTLLSGSETRRGVPGRIRAVPGAAALVGAVPITSGPTTSAPSARAEPALGPAPTWRPAAIGAGVLIAGLGLLAAAIARSARHR
jgi:hypothetical protein